MTQQVSRVASNCEAINSPRRSFIKLATLGLAASVVNQSSLVAADLDYSPKLLQAGAGRLGTQTSSCSYPECLDATWLTDLARGAHFPVLARNDEAETVAILEPSDLLDITDAYSVSAADKPTVNPGAFRSVVRRFNEQGEDWEELCADQHKVVATSRFQRAFAANSACRRDLSDNRDCLAWLDRYIFRRLCFSMRKFVLIYSRKEIKIIPPYYFQPDKELAVKLSDNYQIFAKPRVYLALYEYHVCPDKGILQLPGRPAEEHLHSIGIDIERYEEK